MPGSGAAILATLAPAARENGRRLRASPLARRLARERGVDLAEITGSGPRGRILQRDVEGARPSARATAASAFASLPATRPYPPPTPHPGSAVALSGMRGAIAKALEHSKRTIPHFYATAAIDVTAALALKEEYARAGHRVTVNDLVLRAVTLALLDEPGLNCRVHDDRIEYPREINLGIAVGSDEGLVVPVVLGAERYDLAGLSEASRHVISEAQHGKLVGMGRGTFTVSNLGMYGIESFAAIINPPEGAILAVGGARQELVAAAGGFFPRTILRVTLSADHRAIDGVVAARYLQRLQILLESAQL